MFNLDVKNWYSVDECPDFITFNGFQSRFFIIRPSMGVKRSLSWDWTACLVSCILVGHNESCSTAKAKMIVWMYFTGGSTVYLKTKEENSLDSCCDMYTFGRNRYSKQINR